MINNCRNLFEIVKKDAENSLSRNINYIVTADDNRNVSITYNYNRKKCIGLSPSFSENDIKKEIVSANSILESKETLENAYYNFKEKGIWVDISEDKREDPNCNYVEKNADIPLFKRVMLAFSHHFFFYYKLNDIAESILRDLWIEEKLSEDYFDYIDINDELKKLNERKGAFRKINGRIPDEYIKRLAKENLVFSLDTDGATKYICIKDGCESENTFSITKLYKDIEAISNYLYCVSPKFFYAGAAARLESIKSSFILGNRNIHNYTLNLSKFSYATHLGLKDPRMNENLEYFDKNEREALKRFDAFEADLQISLFRELGSCEHIKKDSINENTVKLFNIYLKKSYYSHGINVSGNLITGENNLIYTKRGDETWDKAMLYCSVNGVCEVFDEDVDFYKKSVSCDYPTIGKYGLTTGNFGEELSRETFAELGVDINPTIWNYYGFTIFGYIRELEAVENERKDVSLQYVFPLHINILAYAKTEKTTEQINKYRKDAVENGEVDNVHGLEIIKKKNIALKRFFGFCKTVYTFNDALSDSLILFVIINMVLLAKKAEGVFSLALIKNTVNDLTLVDKISLVIAAIVLCGIVIKIILYIKRFIKYEYRHVKILCKNTIDLDDFYYRIKNNKKLKNAHPIFSLMILLYYDDLFEQKSRD